MIRTAPAPQSVIVGIFMVLAAVVSAVAPVPTLYRSLGVLLFGYLGFAVGGMPYAYLATLLAPPLGLLSGSVDWLVMLPIVLAGNLLAMLGLEFGWRFPALVVSPLLVAAPQWIAWQASQRDLFAVTLPWNPSPGLWIGLHALVAAAGVLVALFFDRRRARAAGD